MQYYRLLVAVILYAICFAGVFPGIGLDVTLHGNFLTAIAVGVEFIVAGWLVWFCVGFLSFLSGGFVAWLAEKVWWIMPAICLLLTAQLFPQHLSVGGVLPAFIGGLVLTGATYVSHYLSGSPKGSWRVRF